MTSTREINKRELEKLRKRKKNTSYYIYQKGLYKLTWKGIRLYKLGVLDHITAWKGVESKWRTWTHGYLVSSHFSILTNGLAKGFFSASRRIRQGDPLSPFLFTTVVDAFSEILRTVKRATSFKVSKFGKKLFSSLTSNMPMALCFSQTIARITLSTLSH